MGSRSWVFTINNPTENDIKAVQSVPAKAIIAGSEIGESETPHIQGAIIFSKVMRVNAACKMLGGRAHLEKMRGDWADQSYCGKDGELIRQEDNRAQGTRNDLINFREAIKRKSSDIELLENNLQCVAKYPRLLSFARQAYGKVDTRITRDIKVYVRVGPSGTGKSHVPYEKGAFDIASIAPEWWDGYEYESIVVMNEFTGQMPIERFLRITDKYQVQLPRKGGFVWGYFTTMYITSNIHPAQWYPFATKSQQDAVKRRIKKIDILTDNDIFNKN